MGRYISIHIILIMSGNVTNLSIKINSNKKDMVKAHVESYNALFDFGDKPGLIKLMLEDLDSINLDHNSLLSGPVAKVWIEDINIEIPSISNSRIDPRLLPIDCRLRRLNYTGRFFGKFIVKTYEGKKKFVNINLGDFPIMVQSMKCHLYGKSKKELIQMNEDESEAGGYFIYNGIERVIRMLIGIRRN